MRDPPLMKTLRLLACLAAIAASAACSSKSDPTNDDPDAGDSQDGGDPDSPATPPRACTRSGTCPTDSPCCVPDDDGGGAHCAPDPGTPQACLCENSSDCSPPFVCGLAVDSANSPTGPYVCVPNDGRAYDGCKGNPSLCGVPYCCVTDKNGNQFCAFACASSSECGSAKCEPFDFSSAVFCNGGTNACGI